MSGDPGRTRVVPSSRSGAFKPVVLVLVLVLAVVVLRSTLVVPVRITSASMLPTYREGDVVLVSRIAPAVEDLEHGDLVVLRDPEEGQRVLKRVVGLPGEAVVIRDGVLHVADRPVVEPWTGARLDGYYSATWTAGEGQVVVLGDNRGNSIDSRDYGPVAAEDLLGRVLGRVWPVRR